MDREPRLRPGVPPSVVVSSLRPLIAQGANILPAVGGPSIGWTDRLSNAHARWVSDVEHALREYFASPTVWEPLYGRRWTEIRNMERTSPQPQALVGDEVRSQTDRLTEILDRLEAAQVFELPDGTVAVVPDTNIFLHYTYFNELDWLALVQVLDGSVTDVRLVVPSVIVDQLDDQSYKSQPRADRAKSVLRDLRALPEGLPRPEVPAHVRGHVELQVLVDAPGRVARANDDDEILARAEYLAGLVGDRVHIATGDLGMQTRATTRGLRCLVLPMELRLGATSEGPA